MLEYCAIIASLLYSHTDLVTASWLQPNISEVPQRIFLILLFSCSVNSSGCSKKYACRFWCCSKLSRPHVRRTGFLWQHQHQQCHWKRRRRRASLQLRNVKLSHMQDTLKFAVRVTGFPLSATFFMQLFPKSSIFQLCASLPDRGPCWRSKVQDVRNGFNPSLFAQNTTSQFVFAFVFVFVFVFVVVFQDVRNPALFAHTPQAN